MPPPPLPGAASGGQPPWLPASLSVTSSLALVFLAYYFLRFYFLLGAASGVLLFVIVCSTSGGRWAEEGQQGIGMARWSRAGRPEEVESEVGVVAADDWRCSEVGAAALRAGGHAVDSAIAAALCLGVVHPMSSGVGGGAFIVVRSAASGEAEAIDSRETAPSSASTVDSNG